VTIRIDEPSEGVRLLTIDRPERRNAIDLATYRPLTAAIDDADRDPEIRCCVLSGAGNVFTSGNDLADFQQPQGPNPGEATVLFLHTLVSAGTPLVAAVEGFAVGVGATMLLHFDLAFAGRSAQFRLPFVDLGLCPEGGSSYLLPQVAGLKRASELLMLSEKFDAQTAAEAGLINGVVDDGGALDAALDRARALATAPPESVWLAKMLLRQPHREAVVRAIDTEAAHFTERLGSTDAQTAFRRFFAPK
jgi:enoyl-CoA hydratase/carnithine racemase